MSICTLLPHTVPMRIQQHTIACIKSTFYGPLHIVGQARHCAALPLQFVPTCDNHRSVAQDHKAPPLLSYSPINTESKEETKMIIIK